MDKSWQVKVIPGPELIQRLSRFVENTARPAGPAAATMPRGNGELRVTGSSSKVSAGAEKRALNTSLEPDL